MHILVAFCRPLVVGQYHEWESRCYRDLAAVVASRRRVAHWQSTAITRQTGGFDSFRAYQNAIHPWQFPLAMP